MPQPAPARDLACQGTLVTRNGQRAVIAGFNRCVSMFGLADSVTEELPTGRG